MGFREKNKKRKKDLARAHKEQINRREQKGRFPTIFNKEAIPDDIPIWWDKPGDHIIDIVPFNSGPNNPNAKEGQLVYVLELWVHQNIGSMNEPYVCPWENYGLPCPICEYIKANFLEKEEWSKISAKRRVVYLVWVHDTPEDEKKGLQIFEISHHFMEKELDNLARLPRGGGAINFSHYDEGKSIMWTKEKTEGGVDYSGYKFLDREIPIPDSVLDASFPLDSIVNCHPTYEEIEEAFKGQSEDPPLTGKTPFDDGFEAEGTGDDVPLFDEDELKAQKKALKKLKKKEKKEKKAKKAKKNKENKDKEDD